MEKDEEIEKLKEVFQNYSLKDDSKYAITNSSKIQDLLDFIQNSILLNNNNEQQSIMFTLKFISKSFTFFRINIDIFQQNINKNIYIYFIDIYLDNNNVNSNEINPLILKIIDVLVNNLSISKKIIDHIIQKYSYYFYELNVNKDNIYPNLKKLLEVTIHLLGIYLNIKKPKCFYFLTEKDNIIINIDKNDFKDNIGITFWFKSYLDNNCELINFCSDDNKVIKLFIEKNILYILLNEIRFCIGEKIALNNEWNCLTFKFENVKLKKNLNVYLNDKHVLKSYYINNDSFNLENFEISKIILGNNFYGEITSIIILSNTNKNDINTSLLKKLSLMFPFGIITNKDVSDLCKNFESFKNIIKFLYIPFGKKYNLINNIENNLEFNNFHIYNKYQKNICLLGGINIFLPIFEILYLNIEICIKHNDLIENYFTLISTILNYRKKNMTNALNNNFFMILSIFLEKIPNDKNIFTKNLFNIMIEVANNVFNYFEKCTLYLDYFNHILLNEKIITKFDENLQIEFWELFYNKFFNKSKKVIIFPINKILKFIFYYDIKTYYCCKKHNDFLLDKYKCKDDIIDFNLKTKNLFLLIENILKIPDDLEKNLKNIINYLSLKNSPCFMLKIIDIINLFFNDKKYQNIIFDIFCKTIEYKYLLFNLMQIKYLDVKYNILVFILNLSDFNNFKIPMKFIKDNILPKEKNFYNYLNFLPSKNDIQFLSQFCVKKIEEPNLIFVSEYTHDNIISNTKYNISFLYLTYTKFLNLLLSFLSNDKFNSQEILDIIIHICRNMNIEISLDFFQRIYLYCSSNNNLVIKIFKSKPFVNYFLDTLLYYLYINNEIISEKIFKLFIDIISSIKDIKLIIFLLEYMLKYFSLLKNKISENMINNFLSKLISFTSKEYLKAELFIKEKSFEAILTSIFFDYITIFNQDKLLYLSINRKEKNIFDNFENFFENNLSIINIAFLKGLKINFEKDIQPLLNIWNDFPTAKNILEFYYEVLGIEIFIERSQTDKKNNKIENIFNYYINCENPKLNIDSLINDKINILFYISEPEKYFMLSKILSHLYMISLTFCKDFQEYKNILHKYINYILLIIIISSKTNPNTDNQIIVETCQNIITYNIIFLYNLITLVVEDDQINKMLINCFNEILYLNLLFFEIYMNLFLVAPTSYDIIFDLFIKDKNNENENTEIFLSQYKDNFNNFYDVILKNLPVREKFLFNGKLYQKLNFENYIDQKIIINIIKNRLDVDTTKNIYKYNDDNSETYTLDFHTFAFEKQFHLKKIKSYLIQEKNNLFQYQKTKRNYYKTLKKNLFTWNAPWSNRVLYYNEKQKLKYKLYNHYSSNYTRPFLMPIIDLDYYMPNFSLFDPEKLYNKNEIEIKNYKTVCIDIDKILNSIKNSTTDYNYIYNDLLKEDTKYDCCFIKPTHHIKGAFLITVKGILFKVYLNQKCNSNNIEKQNIIADENYDKVRKTCYGSYFVSHKKDKDFQFFTIDCDEIKNIMKRMYYYHETGLEIFTTNHKSYYFNFKNFKIRNAIYDLLLNKITSKDNIENYIIKWKNFKISNMELLMILNIFSGRSYNDISQYPILPWIISDYYHDEINENDLNNEKKIYRDLTIPLGMIECKDGGERKKEFIENLAHTNREYQKILTQSKEDSTTDNMLLFEKPYNYGSHYSNPMYVTHFLSRIFPFCNILIEIQGDKFDEPDRMFSSVKDTFYSCTTQKEDLRELIPEFFSIPEMFFNINNFDMGIRRNKKKVDGVDTGFGGAYKFVYLNNLAFEKNEVSLNLNNWIDLIFGYKQRGKEAEKNNNIYRFASYMDLVDIEKINEEAKLYFYRFLEFGCCPMQLFKKPFDKRDLNILKAKKEIIDKHNNVITLHIKNDKKIVDFFPIEKGVRTIFDDFSGIDYRKIKEHDNNYKYEHRQFSYGHGLDKDDKLIGNSKIDIPKNKPYVLYNKDRFLIEGGFLSGEMVISDFSENKTYIFYNLNDYSVVINITLNKDENFGIVANEIGIIYIYKVNNEIWENKHIINSHIDKIKHISINNELNAFASCAFDDYVNIYSIPSCKIIHSFNIKKPEFVFLSGRPLALCIIYSNEYKKFFVYSVNGNLIKEENCENVPESPFIYKDKYFRDYLIYGSKGNLFIKNLPYMEVFNIIKFGEDELSLKLYKNMEVEKLYVLDKNKGTLYIIGDKSNK